MAERLTLEMCWGMTGLDLMKLLMTRKRSKLLRPKRCTTQGKEVVWSSVVAGGGGLRTSPEVGGCLVCVIAVWSCCMEWWNCCMKSGVV